MIKQNRMVWLACMALVLMAGAAPLEALGEENEAEAITPIAVGDNAPDFALPVPSEDVDNEDAPPWPARLSEYKGEKNVVLAFYPKVFTSGCTQQLCGYRDVIEDFASAETAIVAISVDTQEESDAFRKEYQLPFPVLGDPAHAVVKAYGAPIVEFSGMELARRSVYLVDKDGIVRFIDKDYVIGTDEETLMAQIDALQPSKTED